MPTQPTLDARVDEYIANAEPFAQPILRKIRAAFHAGCPDLTETIKWGIPSFERNGILGGMASFQAHVGYGFWRAAEMDDPHDLLGDVRKSSPMRIKAASTKDLPTKAILVSYVKQARRLDDTAAPKKQSGGQTQRTVPDDFKAALQSNRKAASFWKTLAPGYRRDYIDWVTGAKREATRQKRLEQSIEWLSEGKRKNWKYESC